MPAKTSRRLTPTELATDEAVINALKSVTTYKMVSGQLSLAELEALNARVAEKQHAEQTAQIGAMSTRDAAIAVEWERHEAVMRTKALIVAQYGRDSSEVKAIGLKRQMDRKRPTRRTNEMA
jgi:hypothetical protein